MFEPFDSGSLRGSLLSDGALADVMSDHELDLVEVYRLSGAYRLTARVDVQGTLTRMSRDPRVHHVELAPDVICSLG